MKIQGTIFFAFDLLAYKTSRVVLFLIKKISAIQQNFFHPGTKFFLAKIAVVNKFIEREAEIHAKTVYKTAIYLPLAQKICRK